MYTIKVKEFSDATIQEGCPLPIVPMLMKEDKIAFIRKMVNDEMDELEEATNITEQADALVDAIYYICDTAVRHGMNLDPLFAIVHRANMQKVVNGKVIRNEIGKVQKPACWQDPAPFLDAEVERQQLNGSWDDKSITFLADE